MKTGLPEAEDALSLTAGNDDGAGASGIGAALSRETASLKPPLSEDAENSDESNLLIGEGVS